MCGITFLLGELQRPLPVPGGELFVALDRVEHLGGHPLDQRLGVLLLRNYRECSQKECECEKRLHAAALSFSLSLPLNMPGSSEWRSSRR
jgi:hypothetical protein